jgi:uncharacterized membrane protein
MAVSIRDVVSGSVFGLGTAMAFSVSPIFVRMGMAEGHSAEIGLAIGLIAAALAYFMVLLVSDRQALQVGAVGEVRLAGWELAAALSIVTGTWLRYEAMALVPLAIVSALGRVNILVILLLARRTVTPRVWVGGFLIIAGTVLLSL